MTSKMQRYEDRKQLQPRARGEVTDWVIRKEHKEILRKFYGNVLYRGGGHTTTAFTISCKTAVH